jgi:hypothetical protein
MTWDGVHERRRGPRVNLAPHQVDCRFEMRTRVRLLDISASGALLASDAALPVEAGGRLKAVLAGSRFSPNLQVTRIAPAAPGASHLGTVFNAMDDESRRGLTAFLQKATE